MEIGKIPNDILKEIILDKIKHTRDEVLVRPGVGEDCCAVDFGEYVCVMSTDPITGTVNEIGRLAVHISCNDIASSGVEPLGLMLTILAPPGTTELDLDTVMGQVCETASKLNVEIIGGHTEITAAVNRFVIISTAIGKMLKKKLISTAGAKAGDFLVLTKTAGIEGTAILAKDREEELIREFGHDIVIRAQNFIHQISVIKEGVVAGAFGVSGMHDVTEGGVLGAVWEVCEASNTGVEVYKEKVPIAEETVKIAEFYQIDPLRLISSGSMLITCGNGDVLVEELERNGVKASVIGRLSENKGRILINKDGESEIAPPASDELYKVLN